MWAYLVVVAMGRRREQQSPLSVWAGELPKSPGHPFYEALKRTLEAAGCARCVEGRCGQFYADEVGRPSLAPGRHFRLMVLRPFEGLSAPRESPRAA